MKTIAVTILSGFLGAGKTTFLNKLIERNSGKRFAVIENEFGETGIDGNLVMNLDEGVFELSNGCICCNLNDDLVVVLQKILNFKNPIEHLLIETTGIADPGTVAAPFMYDADLKKYFSFNGIVALADGLHIEEQLEEHEEACRQIALADIVAISKTELLDAYQKETIRNIISRMNANAQITESLWGETTLNILSLSEYRNTGLGTKATNYRLISKGKAQLGGAIAKSIPSFWGDYKQLNHSSFSSKSFLIEDPLDFLRFEIWIRFLFSQSDFKFFRIKGILSFQQTDEKILFQSVNTTVDSIPLGKWGEEVRKSSIVFIGKNIRAGFLERGLLACTSADAFQPEKFYAEISGNQKEVR